MTLRIQVLAAFYNQKKVWVGSLWKTAKAKRLLVLHFLKRWLRGIHQFSKLINRLKRLCVYFYYGANKSCSRAMWALDNQMQSVFLLQAMCSISGLFHDEVESCLHYLYRCQHETMQHTNICVYTCVYLDTAYSVWQMSRILLPYFALITNFVHKTTTPCIIVYYKSYIFFEWIVYVFTTFSFGSNHQENCACFFSL